MLGCCVRALFVCSLSLVFFIYTFIYQHFSLSHSYRVSHCCCSWLCLTTKYNMYKSINNALWRACVYVCITKSFAHIVLFIRSIHIATEIDWITSQWDSDQFGRIEIAFPFLVLIIQVNLIGIWLKHDRFINRLYNKIYVGLSDL